MHGFGVRRPPPRLRGWFFVFALSPGAPPPHVAPLRPAELAELLASVDLSGVAVWVVGRRAPTTVATHPSAAATCARPLAVARAWMAFNSIGVTWG
jgi:hypothetical protein